MRVKNNLAGRDFKVTFSDSKRSLSLSYSPTTAMDFVRFIDDNDLLIRDDVEEINLTSRGDGGWSITLALTDKVLAARLRDEMEISALRGVTLPSVLIPRQERGWRRALKRLWQWMMWQ